MYNIIVLGIVSLLTDISTEMVYPLIPLFLSRLGAAPALMGIIEGIAESLASLLKVFSGAACDRFKKKKPIALFGYAASAVNKVILIAAASWWGVLIARVIDRFGKGVRTAPRDVLIAEGANGRFGRAFGLHKMLDMLGSAIGILLSYIIVLNIGLGKTDNYQSIFLVSLIPAVLGVAAIFFVREKGKSCPDTRKLGFKWSALDGRLRAFLVVIFLFTLGNSSNTFLLLRAKERGLSDSDVILAYFVFNIMASLLAYPFGRLADRVGKRTLLVIGYALYGVVYAGFALVSGSFGVFALFAAYGFYTALTAGVERAFVSEIAPPHLKGTMLGLYSTLVGIGLLPASVAAGLLWSAGPAVPFWFGSATGICASVAFAILLKSRESKEGAGI
jgi:MFS family permease